MYKRKCNYNLVCCRAQKRYHRAKFHILQQKDINPKYLRQQLFNVEPVQVSYGSAEKTDLLATQITFFKEFARRLGCVANGVGARQGFGWQPPKCRVKYPFRVISGG